MWDGTPDSPVFNGAFGTSWAGAQEGATRKCGVGRNGPCPVGARRRRHDDEPRGPVRSAWQEACIAVFCSFLKDNFTADVHPHVLARFRTNNPIIPVEDTLGRSAP